MIHTACNRNNRSYRYYVYTSAQKRGYSSGATKSVKADSIERAVLEQIRRIPIDAKRLDASPIREATCLLNMTRHIANDERARLIRLLIKSVTYDRAATRLGLELTDEGASCIKTTA